MRQIISILLLLAACTANSQPQSELPRLNPQESGFSTARLDSIGHFLRQKVTEDVFPGGVLLLGRADGVVYSVSVGEYGDDDHRPVSTTTIYDLASLTKVIGLTTAVMLLVADGKLDIETTVVSYVPEFTHPSVTLRHLLTHTSGLAPWVPLFQETETAEEALAYIYQAALENQPGEAYNYSDLGAILLTQVVERVAAQPLEVFLEERVFGPLGMLDTRFRPDSTIRSRIAPTEQDPWRGRMIRGEVHDENAAHLGGVSGHAGLFSTAPDLARFAIWLLDIYHARSHEAEVSLPADILRAFTARQPTPEGSYRGLGWGKSLPEGRSSAGRFLSPSSFGHTGFTGTSIWVDPERDLFVVLLTNRVHPTRENRALIPIRGTVTDMVIQSMVNTQP